MNILTYANQPPVRPGLRACPACGSRNHVEGSTELLGDTRPTVYWCSPFGPKTDRGCGHRWEARS